MGLLGRISLPSKPKWEDDVVNIDYLDILRREFSGEDDSFLIKLRPGLEWDKEAFSRLTTAMEVCCMRLAGSEMLERWLAEGFWYVSWFVKSWTTNENFPRLYPKAYFDESYQRIDDLAYWFFRGESPYLSEHENGP